jgi:hypothetical protein
MLFILAIDPLQRILQLAAERGVLHPISPRSRGIKASLYADDTAIFVSPRKHDIAALKEILSFFREASGLCTNLQKTEVFPISHDGADLDDILEGFQAAVKFLPCRYLGLPLRLKKLSLSTWQSGRQASRLERETHEQGCQGPSCQVGANLHCDVPNDGLSPP